MSLRLAPVEDRNTDRNFRDVETAVNGLPALGKVADRWRFSQSADAVTLRLEYFDGKNWVVKASWPT